MSQLVHVRLPDEIYLFLKSQKLNMTELFTLLAQNYCDVEQNVDTDEQLLIDEIAKIKGEVKVLNEQLATSVVRLSMVQAQKAKSQKEYEKELEAYDTTLKESGVLNDF